ncbi:MAG TPA: hypothetical protein EYN89_05040 [Flavobacteriales bacterium]|nr:hypothetical protein [Flavobacteriales bacterium]
MKKIYTIVIVFCSVLAWGFASGQSSVTVSANQKANAQIKKIPLLPLDTKAGQLKVLKEEEELDAKNSNKQSNSDEMFMKKKKAAYIPPKPEMNAEKPKR